MSGSTVADESSLARAESAGSTGQISRRDGSNPTTLCDGHDVDFVTVTGQILMAVHSYSPGHAATRHRR
jgi:hypothetical protein